MSWHKGFLCLYKWADFSTLTCRSTHWSWSGRWWQLFGVETPVGVQAVWLQLLRLPHCFSRGQVTRAESLSEMTIAYFFCKRTINMMYCRTNKWRSNVDILIPLYSSTINTYNLAVLFDRTWLKFKKLFNYLLVWYDKTMPMYPCSPGDNCIDSLNQ